MNAFRLATAAMVASTSLAIGAADALYPAIDRAKADVDSAMKRAAREHKRVIVDFGGNWCTDCKILDINLKKPENAALLEKNFIVVHVNVGDKGISDNFEVAERFGVPLKKGVPALAVLDSSGRVLYAQKNGEFESMRTMDPKSVNDFLEHWRNR
jgi:thioredoxin 1